MTGVEFGAAAAGRMAASSLDPLGRPIRRRTWKRRLARATVKAVLIKRSTPEARQLKRLIRRALGDWGDPDRAVITAPTKNQAEPLCSVGIEPTGALLRITLEREKSRWLSANCVR